MQCPCLVNFLCSDARSLKKCIFVLLRHFELPRAIKSLYSNSLNSPKKIRRLVETCPENRVFRV